MKRLLLILLLFFPVHGAWGDIITINCKPHSINAEKMPIGEKDIETFILDINRQVVLNASEVPLGHNLKITNTSYNWDDTPRIIEAYNTNIEENSPKYISSTYVLNRITGELLNEVVKEDDSRSKIQSSCEKAPINKF